MPANTGGAGAIYRGGGFAGMPAPTGLCIRLEDEASLYCPFMMSTTLLI